MAQRACSHLPGDHGDPARCPRLTSHPSSLCDIHLAAQRARTDANRPSAHQRGYDGAHRADLHRAQAAGQRCQHNGCQRSDIHRDHVDGNPSNNHPANIAWLCQTHHSAKTLNHDIERDASGRILPKRQQPKRSRIRSIGT